MRGMRCSEGDGCTFFQSSSGDDEVAVVMQQTKSRERHRKTRRFIFFSKRCWFMNVHVKWC